MNQEIKNLFGHILPGLENKFKETFPEWDFKKVEYIKPLLSFHEISRDIFKYEDKFLQMEHEYSYIDEVDDYIKWSIYKE